MHKLMKTTTLLAAFFFVTTVSLDAISHIDIHDDHGHEYECPFSNNKVIETDVSDPIKESTLVLLSLLNSSKVTFTQQLIIYLIPEHLQKFKLL